MHYVVLTLHPGTGPTAKIQDYRFEIFTGKTAFAAANRARESLLASTVSSREDSEEEHGKVTDEEFLKVLDEGGFMIIPASLNEG
jgi:hypothetical protein